MWGHVNSAYVEIGIVQDVGKVADMVVVVMADIDIQVLDTVVLEPFDNSPLTGVGHQGVHEQVPAAGLEQDGVAVEVVILAIVNGDDLHFGQDTGKAVLFADEADAATVVAANSLVEGDQVYLVGGTVTLA
jgi:hypothetical protein